VIFCVDEFGPLNPQPRPGRQWAAIGGKGKEPGRAPRPRLGATYTRKAGVRHLFAAYDLGEDKLYRHIKPRKTRASHDAYPSFPAARRARVYFREYLIRSKIGDVQIGP
jgi:hypothetical protein